MADAAWAPAWRRVAALGVGLVLASGLLLVTALPANAHALLVGSEPADGAVLGTSPARVLLHFSEAVQVGPNGVRVLDARGVAVSAGGARLGPSDIVTVDLRPQLPTGTYLVSWRVVSDDTHPVTGGLLFGVGTAPSATSALQATTEGNGLLDVLAGFARGLGYLGIALTVGATAFLVLVGPVRAGPVRGPRRTAGRLPTVGLVALAAGAVLQFGVQGAQASGNGVGGLVSGSDLADTTAGPLGPVLVARGLLIVVAAFSLPRLLNVRPARPAPTTTDPAVEPATGPATGPATEPAPTTTDPAVEPATRPATEPAIGPAIRPVVAGVAVCTGVALAVTFALAGHARSGPVLAVISWTLHVLAMSVWLGGLAVLAVTTAGGRDRAVDLGLLARLPNWSRMAQAAVAALAVTGAYQVWRQTDGLHSVTATAYGRLLVIKLVLVGVMLAAATAGYAWLRRRYADLALASSWRAAPGSGTGPPRWWLRLELVAGVLVIAVTAALVGQAPATSARPSPAVAARPTFDDRAPAGPFTVLIHVAPAVLGPEEATVRVVDSTGAAVPVEQVTGRFALPERDLGPFRVSFRSDGSGEFTGRALAALPGRWELTLSVQLDALTDYVTLSSYDVR